MMRGILLFALGAIVVVAGVVGYQMFFASSTPSNTAANGADARDQFLSDRGGAVVTATNGFAGGGFPGGGGAFGTVASIDGNTIKVTSFNSSTTTIKLATDAKISKPITGTIADVKVGDPIVILASQSGTALTAETVQVGGAMGFGASFAGGGFGGGPNAQGTPGAGFGGGPNASGTPFTRGARPNRTPGANAGFGGGAGTGGPAFTPVTGTVKAVDAASITVTAADGASTTVAVGANTTFRSQQSLTLADVKVGDTVVATGAMNGDTFEATALEVGAIGGAGNFGGPGGFSGPGGPGGGAPGAGSLETPTP